MAARVLNTYVTKGTSSDNLNIKLDHLNLVQQNDIDHLIIDDHQLNQINILREPFLPEIEQYYHEIESFNNEEKEDQFNKLENLARSTRLYKNEKILALCDKYVLSNNDYSLLARVLDLVKRLLSTSLEIDGSNDFVSHVRSKYSLKFREIILSIEKDYENAQHYVRQILEWYKIFNNDDLEKLYWQSVKNYIKVENLELNEFRRCVDPYFSKIKESDDFRTKCRSEIFGMTKHNDEKIKQRAKLLMKLF
jgi:hypothetical protein